MSWLSPSFPVGAYSYSHGLEWAIEQRLVCGQPGLVTWLADLLEQGGGWADALLLAESWRAAATGDAQRLASAAELGLALAPTSELLIETAGQGLAFARTVTAAWPAAGGPPEPAQDGPLPYPCAVGRSLAAVGIPLELALAAYLHAFSANLVSAAVRLVPLGQTDGQRAMAAMEPTVLQVAKRALDASFDELGTAALMSEWCSMRHETQHTRLFRS